MSPSAEEVGRYSSDGSSRSKSRGRSRSARKHQKSVSRKKRISKSHQSVRSKIQSISNSKSVKSKPQSLKASQRRLNSDSGHPELAKKLNDKISKTIDKRWERVRAFIRGEMAAETIEVILSPR
nr:hypothetical protein [Tanacetum cinerariifolium]